MGVLLCRASAPDDPLDGFGLLSEAVSTFLGQTVKGYGHFLSDRLAYQSVLWGRPLCIMPKRDANARILARIAGRFSEEFFYLTP